MSTPKATGTRFALALLSVVVVAISALALAACGGGSTAAAPSSPAPTAAAAPSIAPEAAASATSSAAPTGPTNLGDLKPITAYVGWGTYCVGRYSFTSQDPNDRIDKGDRMFAHGTWYRHGVYAHAPSRLTYRLDGRFSTFSSTLVMVDSIPGEDVDGVVFVVRLDGAEIFRSSPMLPTSEPRDIKLSVAGGQALELVTEPRGDNGCDWAIWGDPVLTPLPTPTVAGTILFDSDRGDLSVVRTDGSGLRRVIKSPRAEGSANWSPDGRLIACTVHYDQNIYGVAVAKADGSEARRLPLGKLGGCEPSWSPDGTRLAYNTPGPYPHCHIFVCDADGSHRRQLTDGPEFDVYPEWTPDGQTILFLRVNEWGGPSPGDVYSVRPDGSGLTQVTSTGMITEFALSPDGSQLAVHDYLTDAIVLLPYGTSDSPKTILDTDFGWGVVNMSWSPDGKALVLGTSDDGNNDPDALLIVNADGSGLSAIPGVKEAEQPVWRPE